MGVASRDGSRALSPPRLASAEAPPIEARAHTALLNARPGPTTAQWSVLVVFTGGVVAAFAIWPQLAVEAAHTLFLALFGTTTVWRLVVLGIARPPVEAPALLTRDLPPYTIIAPLLREGAMVRPLLEALDRIDYPRDRLQIVLALECDDGETRLAVEEISLPSHVEVLIVPPGAPRTKPRACNAALAIARGEHVVVFDAEDRPHPGQLREAAARFAGGDAELACLQAPLRIKLDGSFTMRQFALEYAALFELMLPALARIGAPFPLGGTSNHFRADVLRRVGGWDAWNVTEDADLGFRLPMAGYRLGVLSRPTFEDAPRGAAEWVPQRSRWLKGYMQTWGVYMRRPSDAGLPCLLTLQVTVGLTILSAMIHAPTALLIAFQVMAATTPFGTGVSPADLLLFGGGWGVAVLCMSSGARRAGERPRLSDALLAPAYWSLQSVAFWRALYQLIACPHHWDKTPHHPPKLVDAPASLDEAGAVRVGEAA